MDPLIGKRVRVWFDEDGCYYNAKIAKFSQTRGYNLHYDDGDQSSQPLIEPAPLPQ